MRCELTNISDQQQDPPDCGTDDNPNALFDAVMRLLDTTPRLDDYCDELIAVANKVNMILAMDATDAERMSLIRDAFYLEKSRLANFLEKYPDNCIVKKALES